MSPIIMSRPWVSIILAVFNQAPSLARAIESVMQQTNQDWELIIVDDGSIDGSAQVAQKIISAHSKMKLFAREHRGVSEAINFGFTMTQGEYITTLDGDDYYKPNHLEDNLQYLSAHPEADLIMSKTEVIGDPLVADIESPGHLIHIDECAAGGTFFVRRAVFEAVGGRPPVQYGTDYYFLQNVRSLGYVIEQRDTRTYVYDRTGSNSISKDEARRLGI